MHANQFVTSNQEKTHAHSDSKTKTKKGTMLFEQVQRIILVKKKFLGLGVLRVQEIFSHWARSDHLTSNANKRYTL